jgi:predicted DNA-binding antitoxin AbrB/MazE fold protein
MIQRITAVVEQGRLRPTTPLALTEGAEVQIVIESVTEPPPKFSGRDHDRILYGGEGGAR